ncbi:MAG: pseudouridine synthase [Pseudomonadota bacterium]
MKERLQKIIARAGFASRRKAEELILHGRVSINGSVVTELGTQADPGRDIIAVNGVPVGQAENKIYILLNKPYGYITSLHDPEGRPTVISLVKDVTERIVPVGRLDYDTEGLLILTNDGDFSQILQHPSYRIDRIYLVKVKGFPAQQVVEKLQAGVFIEGKKTAKSRIRVVKKAQKNTWFEIILREGRNRQIKKMFEAVQHTVLRIIRIQFGPLTLDDLPTGTYRFLNKKEIEEVKSLAK